MRCLPLLVLAGTLAAALPLPYPALQPHGETPLPTAAGLVGKVQVHLIVDWSIYDDASRKHPGREAYWSARWHFGEWRTGDQALFALAIAANGSLPTRRQNEKEEVFAKAQDGSGGLVRALAGGDAVAVLILVDADGRISDLRRHAGDFHPWRERIDKLIEAGADPLIAGPAAVGAGAAPALELLKKGDARAALALATRRLGADGAAFASIVAERAEARLAAETDLIANPAQPPGHRFLASRRLEGLLAEFPRAPSAAAALEALKKLRKDDTEVQREAQGWNALEQYLTQAGRQSPPRLAAFQKQALAALQERFADTEAARIARLIHAAARLE